MPQTTIAHRERRVASPSPRSARERLLSAALARFDAEGALGATLEDVRRDAGVSVGALYHHFPDKAALAGALYADLIGAFQDGFVGELRTRSDAEEGVKAGVRFYLRWVVANRAAASFLLGGRPKHSAELSQRNREFLGAVTDWWTAHAASGALRSLPLDVIDALWLGPAHEYTRHWLAGRGLHVPGAVADILAQAAWQALKQAA
jgi:AcrR family transcriptional regulator